MVLRQQLNRDFSIGGSIRRGVGMGRKCRGIGEELFRIIRHHGDGGSQVFEHIVRQHGFHLGALGLGLGDDGIHGLAGNPDDGLFLPLVGFRDKGVQTVGLMQDHHRVGGHRQQQKNDHQVKNLTLDASQNEIFEFLH